MNNSRKKKNIIEEVKTGAIADGVTFIAYLFGNKTLPEISECASYKTIMDYLQNSKYTLKETANGINMNIAHKDYITLKIASNQNNYGFKKISLEKKDDNLEAIIVLDNLVLNREFHISIDKKDAKDKYGCSAIIYGNRLIYHRPAKTK